jgi:hypothetical protein
MPDHQIKPGLVNQVKDCLGIIERRLTGSTNTSCSEPGSAWLHWMSWLAIGDQCGQYLAAILPAACRADRGR